MDSRGKVGLKAVDEGLCESFNAALCCNLKNDDETIIIFT